MTLLRKGKEEKCSLNDFALTKSFVMVLEGLAQL